MSRCRALIFLALLPFWPMALASPVLAQVIKTPATACSNASETYFWEQSSICNTTSSLWQRPAFQFGSAIASCGASTAGMIQWTGTSMQLCNGTAWANFKQGQTLEDGLIFWFKLDETSGTTVTDETGNHNGDFCADDSETRCAPTWAPTGGHDGGGALYLDGAYDMFQVPASKKFTVLPFTISLWAKPEWLPSTYGAIIEIMRYHHGADPWVRVGMRLSITDKPWFTLNEYSGPTVRNIYAANAASTGTWYHMVGVVETDHTMRMYVNGTAESSTSSVPTFLLNSTTNTPIYFGSGVPAGNSNNFKGWIDDVRYYSRALSADEVTELYNGG